MKIWSVWIHLSALLQPDALAMLCFPIASTVLNGISSFQPLQSFFFLLEEKATHSNGNK